MKSLIYTYSPYINQEMAIDLIPMGIEGLETASKDEAFLILKKDENIPIMITENIDINFISEAKKLNENLNIFLVVHESMKPADLIPFLKMGIRSVLHFTENVPLMVDEIIKNVVQYNIHIKDKRAHLRVQPLENEHFEGSIFLKQLKKFVRGSVLDISAGGVAIHIPDTLDVSLLTPKTVYDPLILTFQGFNIKTLATLVALRNNAAGFRFDNIEQASMRRVSAYIHGRIKENIKALMEQNA